MATYDQAGNPVDPPDTVLQDVTLSPSAKMIDPTYQDVPEITVTAKKLPANFADWLKPPKVYILIGAGAVLLYMLTRPRRR